MILEHGCRRKTKITRLSRVGSKTHSFRETARRSRRCEAVDFCARAEAVLIFLEVGYTHARVIDISHARRACRPATNLACGRRFRVVLDSRRKRTALFWSVIKVTQEEWGGDRESISRQKQGAVGSSDRGHKKISTVGPYYYWILRMNLFWNAASCVWRQVNRVGEKVVKQYFVEMLNCE